MKAVFCLLATAAAVAPPRIELDLSAMNVLQNSELPSTLTTGTGLSGVTGNAEHAFDGTHVNDANIGDKLQTPTYTNGVQTGTTHVQARQDWSQQCAAETSTVQSCPFPEAKAYDHNDQAVQVHEHAYLIDFDGQEDAEGRPTFTCGVTTESLPAEITPSDIFDSSSCLYRKRATYLFKYDAVDGAGNRAEQVVFALIMNDLDAPTINGCYGSSDAVTVEAGSAYVDGSTTHREFFCKSAFETTPKSGVAGVDISSTAGVSPAASQSAYTAQDGIDGALAASSITFDVFDAASGIKSSATASVSGQTLAQTRAHLNTILTNGVTAEYIVEAVVSDNAKYYGTNGASNEARLPLAVTIQDTVGPILTLTGPEKDYAECCRTGADCSSDTYSGYSDDLATANDANDGVIAWSGITKTGTITVDGTDYVSDGVEPATGTGLTVDLTTKTDLTQSEDDASYKKIYFHVTDAKGTDGTYTNAAGQQSKVAMRTVVVADRNPPTISLIGADIVDIQSTKAMGAQAAEKLLFGGSNSLDEGVNTADTCNGALPSVTVEWEGGNSPGAFEDVGDFVRVYTVCDRVDGGSTPGVCVAGKKWGTLDADGVDRTHCCADANEDVISCCATVKRTFSVTDGEAPEIKVMGNTAPTEPASNTQEYTDAGASCTDYVDGVLSHAVEVSGEVVNMRVPGQYVIRYDCIDLSGKEATPKYRTVTVADNTAPIVHLAVSSTATVFVEAGFQYEDAGFTCTDDLDGDLHGIGPFHYVAGDYAASQAGCITDGNTVNVAQEFYNRHSCADIKQNCADTAHCGTGEYYITIFNSVSSKNERLLVWCNMDSGKTYFPVTSADTMAVPESTGSNNDCVQKYGMQMATYTGPNAAEEKDIAQDKFGMTYFPAGTSPTNVYLCSVNDENTAKAAATAEHSELRITNGAEVGTYTIQFKCMDRSGNKDEDWESGTPVSRTVTVKDTLPPVITLHLKENMELIAQGKGDQTGLGGEANPAGIAGQNPNILMAEESSTSVNGWIVGALASAVSGLALLGYSLRRSNDVVTSVPV